MQSMRLIAGGLAVFLLLLAGIALTSEERQAQAGFPNCFDGLDDDGDGLIDAADPECGGTSPTPAPNGPTPTPCPAEGPATPICPPTPTPATPTATPPPPLPPPFPPTTSLTLNRTGTVSRDGFEVGLSGTLTCAPAGRSAFLNVNAFQFVRGQVLLGAFGFGSFTCSGVPQSWAVTAESFTGFFKPGQANVRVTLSTFGPGGFDEEMVTDKVRLRRGDPPPQSPPESAPFLGATRSEAGIVVGGVLGGVLAIGLGAGFLRVLSPARRRRDTDS
jgi:hypothetical protein